MGCRCNERRQAVVKLIRATSDGNADVVSGEAKFIAKSAAEDVGSQMRQRIVAARQFLQGRAR